ncbi:Rieske (2Fe-2S) protein [Brevundimonas lenta]|uniref:Nitrite reductase/ring-hydroxylating ferredoxin subunit n=1 Tax=Brevundimonas lenta TaxID=424796 RepID=A0A7W6JAH4_9CAUL|nr:Rieske 2Fe-2S domain-containing protein [Brevundimonas lenta]MBB4081548.1 nitrite reductase/ring-hydroxylating ferredoxin subunit [Brevundimonas lenta]
MAEFTKVTTVDKLPPGRGASVRIGATDVAVFNVGGVFHAIDGVCPHQGGLLGLGRLSGCVVKCPEHGMRFDVTTGTSPGAPPGGGLACKVFEVKVEGDDVMVSV